MRTLGRGSLIWIYTVCKKAYSENVSGDDRIDVDVYNIFWVNRTPWRSFAYFQQSYDPLYYKKNVVLADELFIT